MAYMSTNVILCISIHSHGYCCLSCSQSYDCLCYLSCEVSARTGSNIEHSGGVYLYCHEFGYRRIDKGWKPIEAEEVLAFSCDLECLTYILEDALRVEVNSLGEVGVTGNSIVCTVLRHIFDLAE